MVCVVRHFLHRRKVPSRIGQCISIHIPHKYAVTVRKFICWDNSFDRYNETNDFVVHLSRFFFVIGSVSRNECLMETQNDLCPRFFLEKVDRTEVTMIEYMSDFQQWIAFLTLHNVGKGTQRKGSHNDYPTTNEVYTLWCVRLPFLGCRTESRTQHRSRMKRLPHRLALRQ